MAKKRALHVTVDVSLSRWHIWPLNQGRSGPWRMVSVGPFTFRWGRP